MQNLYKNSNIFFNISEIPIAVFLDNKLILRLPADYKSVSEILQREFTKQDICQKNVDEVDVPFFVTNEYMESFVVYNPSKNLSIIAGPVITSPIYEGTIHNIMDANEICTKYKTALSLYYEKTISLISSQKYYYIGALLEKLFFGFEILEDSQFEESEEDINKIIKLTYENREKDFIHSPFFLEQRLMKEIKNGNFSQAANILAEIQTLKRATLSTNPLRSLKNSLICSCTLFTRASIEAGLLPEIAFNVSDAFILNIDKAESIKEAEQIELKMIMRFINLINESNTLKYSLVVAKAIEYINIHITEKIRLSDIASYCYVHPNYLSSIFKREVGENVSEFILRKKVEDSVYLILHSEYSIVEIANIYNFCSQSYYTHVFKKIKGVTPNVYLAGQIE